MSEKQKMPRHREEGSSMGINCLSNVQTRTEPILVLKRMKKSSFCMMEWFISLVVISFFRVVNNIFELVGNIIVANLLEN